MGKIAGWNKTHEGRGMHRYEHQDGKLTVERFYERSINTWFVSVIDERKNTISTGEFRSKESAQRFATTFMLSHQGRYGRRPR